MADARHTLACAVSEKNWQRDVIDVARTFGWRVYHTLDSRGSEPGFPDLVLVRERVVFAELKSERGRVTNAQRDWLDDLDDAGAEVYVWRPSELDEVAEILRRVRRDEHDGAGRYEQVGCIPAVEGER